MIDRAGPTQAPRARHRAPSPATQRGRETQGESRLRARDVTVGVAGEGHAVKVLGVSAHGSIVPTGSIIFAGVVSIASGATPPGPGGS